MAIPCSKVVTRWRLGLVIRVLQQWNSSTKTKAVSMSTTTTTVEPKDKVALVTGSTSGIGLAIARNLAKRGVNVILTGSRDKSLVADIVEEIRSCDVRCDYVPCDLRNSSNISSLWSEVSSLYEDGVDILINNAAGYTDACELEKVLDEQIDSMLAVTLSAPFYLTKRCLPGMKRKGWGRIINISSVFGMISTAGVSIYSACKHGLIGFSKGVALETAQCGITCNVVCPGCVRTPMADKSNALMMSKGMSRTDITEWFRKFQPTGKIIEPDQVAELVEFLCLSNASSQMTGAAYLIDGGIVAQ